jgi:hypothetical protein
MLNKTFRSPLSYMQASVASLRSSCLLCLMCRVAVKDIDFAVNVTRALATLYAGLFRDSVM